MLREAHIFAASLRVAIVLICPLVINRRCAYRDEEQANWPLLVSSERLGVIALREED